MDNCFCPHCRSMGNCLKASKRGRRTDSSMGDEEYPPGPQSSPVDMTPSKGPNDINNIQQLYQIPMPIYYPVPNDRRPASNLTEEEQVKIIQRIGLIESLPSGLFDESEGVNVQREECVICMIEFVTGGQVRYLPCMHYYHRKCIDDWLMRSFTCPICMDPVDVALFSYQTEYSDFDI